DHRPPVPAAGRDGAAVLAAACAVADRTAAGGRRRLRTDELAAADAARRPAATADRGRRPASGAGVRVMATRAVDGRPQPAPPAAAVIPGAPPPRDSGGPCHWPADFRDRGRERAARAPGSPAPKTSDIATWFHPHAWHASTT